MPLKILNACFWEEEREQSVSTFWFTCHNVHSNLRWASPSKNAGLNPGLTWVLDPVLEPSFALSLGMG